MCKQHIMMLVKVRNTVVNSLLYLICENSLVVTYTNDFWLRQLTQKYLMMW